MTQLPSQTLILHDSEGLAFGFLRFAPNDDKPGKGECLFDIRHDPAQGPLRSEARWLAKRHYIRWSEHRYEIDGEGAITVRQGDFSMVLHPDEEGHIVTRAPAPPITGVWEV